MRLNMSPGPRNAKQRSTTDRKPVVTRRFVIEVSRLADGTTEGLVTDLTTGRAEVFCGWSALLAILADDRPPDTK